CGYCAVGVLNGGQLVIPLGAALVRRPLGTVSVEALGRVLRLLAGSGCVGVSTWGLEGRAGECGSWIWTSWSTGWGSGRKAVRLMQNPEYYGSLR
ncbi:MAG: hypothetical protein ACRD22_18810, partial [Terriglobia bacterium]